jgi:hypothetical protein
MEVVEMIILDVWGGVKSMDHIARCVLDIKEALALAEHEIESGFLINLRKDAKFGPQHNFDNRIANSALAKARGEDQ